MRFFKGVFTIVSSLVFSHGIVVAPVNVNLDKHDVQLNCLVREFDRVLNCTPSAILSAILLKTKLVI